jgi:DNA polymerase
MQKEMPKRHWQTLPETEVIDELLRDAPRRVEAMMSATAPKSLSICKNTGSAADFLPARITLRQLQKASKTCRGCDLYCNATQTVFGEGSANARVMFVGEQPGDQEDIAGKPFVGPAGKLLDGVLQRVGIDRRVVYVTNAVKHFKFEPRGKRRIHLKPNAREVSACLPWLRAEANVLKPDLVVALGSTAAQAMLGRDFRVTRDRGRPIEGAEWASRVIATVHPSSILRAPDDAARHEAMSAFEADMRVVKKQLDEMNPRRTRAHA